MKRSNNIIAICIFSLIAFELYSQEKPNYLNKNGTITSTTQNDSLSITIRKHDQDVIIGDLATPQERIVYDNYIGGNKIEELKDNDKISISEICTLDSQKTDKKEIWFHIKKGIISGWIRDDYSDPYSNNTWSIIETITSSGEKWTVRKLEQALAVWEVLNVSDMPGVSGTQVLLQLKPGITDPVQTNITTMAITEEYDLIDGRKDHWLKITYKGNVGWIFGGYASAERGGPKYYIPEYVVDFALGWY